MDGPGVEGDQERRGGVAPGLHRARLGAVLRHLRRVAPPRPAPRPAAAAPQPDVDFVIRGARVVDGTGGPAFLGDLAVADGTITYVGAQRYAGAGARELDARGKALAPGFIDVHTHYDPQLCWDPRADPALKHGVCTVITGNCSLSLAPATTPSEVDRIKGMFQSVEDIRRPTFDAGVPFEHWSDFAGWLEFLRGRLRVNVGALIGHSTIRLHAMGEGCKNRLPTPEEMAVMCRVVEDAMRAGALGVSSSYIDGDEDGLPVPAVFSELEEQITLASAMGRSGQGRGGEHDRLRTTFSDWAAHADGAVLVLMDSSCVALQFGRWCTSRL